MTPETAKPVENAKPFNEKELLKLHRDGTKLEDGPRLMATIGHAGMMVLKLQEELAKSQALSQGYVNALMVITKQCGGKMAFPESAALQIKAGSKLQMNIDQATRTLVIQLIEPEEKKIIVAQDVPKAPLKLIEKYGAKQQ